MSDDLGVQFEDDLASTPTPTYSKPSSSPFTFLTKFLISSGFAKDDRSAEFILLGLVVLAIALAIGIAIFSNQKSASPPNIQEYIQEMKAQHS
jgi:hypothetical protein